MIRDTIQTASPFLDEPWPRLAWITPLALAIWLAVLLAFGLILKETAAPPPELQPVEARIVEIPPPVAGLQGGPAVAPHPAAPPAVSKPRPQVKVHRRVAAVHPHTEKSVPHKEKIVPEPPPSMEGTRKEAPAQSSPATTSASTGPSIGRSGGSSSGLGSDNIGARAIYSPAPEIPDDLREETFSTEAVAHFDVSYDGKVKVTLVKPTASPRLNEILLSTLQQWRFFPAMKGGIAIDSSFDVRIPISVQ